MKVKMTFQKRIYYLLALSGLCFGFFSLSGCHIYKFHDVSISSDIKTVKVSGFLNTAQYVNPQFCPKLTDKLRQLIVSQTRLSQTNSDNADWEISGSVTGYSISTSAISGQVAANNRLTATVHITKYDRKTDKTDEYDVSRSFEFPASQSLQQAESANIDELIRSLTNDIFTRLFSNW